MCVNGVDCSIIFKTSHFVIDVPYSSETIREAVTMFYEEASIEGDGTIKALQKHSGVTGCVVTPLTLSTAPILIYLAFGFAHSPVFVSGTRDMHQSNLRLVPYEDSEKFDLIQDRCSGKSERQFFENCRVKSFELRIEREQSIKLKIDVDSDIAPRIYPYDDIFQKEQGEHFHSNYVVYSIDGKEYQNVYGVTIISKKENGTKTEIWIKRVLDNEKELLDYIEQLTITARLIRDKYEDNQFGRFNITLNNLVLISDETNIESSDAVMGLLRYHANKSVSADVFSFVENAL
jgi:uncharacterized protein YrzB (UPF0473 family)